MDYQQRIKVIQDWAAGKFRPPVAQSGNGAVKTTQSKGSAVRLGERRFAPMPSSQEDVAVGVYTSVCGNNAELMERVATLYFRRG